MSAAKEDQPTIADSGMFSGRAAPDAGVFGALVALIDRRIAEALSKQKRKKPVNDYLSTNEAAELARVTPGTIRRWVRRGELTKHEAGKRIRVRRAELERYLTTGVIAIDMTPEEKARRRFGG